MILFAILSFNLKILSLLVSRGIWEKERKKISVKFITSLQAAALALSSIFLLVCFTYAVLSPSTDSVKGASFNTQYAMSIYEQIFPALDITELMHIITHYNQTNKIDQVLYRGIFDLSTKSTRQFYSTILTGRSLEIFLRVSTSEMVSYTLKPCKIQYELLLTVASMGSTFTTQNQ